MRIPPVLVPLGAVEVNNIGIPLYQSVIIYTHSIQEDVSKGIE